MSSPTVNITWVCESGFLRGGRKWMKTSELIVFCHRTLFKCSSPTFPIGMKVQRLTESPNWMPKHCVKCVSRSICLRANHIYSSLSHVCCVLHFFLIFIPPFLMAVVCQSLPGCDSLFSHKWMMAFIIIMPCGKQLGQSNVFSDSWQEALDCDPARIRREPQSQVFVGFVSPTSCNRHRREP